jgi:hypothetical protein
MGNEQAALGGIGLLAGAALAARICIRPQLGFAVTTQMLSITGSAVAWAAPSRWFCSWQ